MSDALLIVAVLNGARTRAECPTLPVSPEELAAEARRAVDAGAGMVAVQAPAFDLVVDDVVAAIRAAVDAPVCLSTQRARQTSLGTVTALFDILRDVPDLGAVHVRPPAPDLPAHREEARQILEALDRAGVRPAPAAGGLDAIGDLEVLNDDSLLGRAPFLSLVLGAPASSDPDVAAGTPLNALRLVDHARSVLAGLPIVAGARDGASAPVQAAAAAAGAHVRAGLEDSVVLPDGTAATSSAQLVERAVRLGEALGRPPMGPDDARLLIR